ncbi:MAG: indolepyruvate ferredoxin oxidoreductase subunit alpha [Methanothrix sp.]|uniref:indolepyruvate ferredoxin oxidoreductase subunit alpha n=1 Tax=Methanothrix sp. TaxID=90426 RepID=UPI003BB794B4
MREYLLGNAAIAKGLLEAGIGLAAGYPGTPSSEIIEGLVELKGDLPLHIEWSVNEKVALEVAAGASWTGCRSVATMKHVGLNVAADPFMTLAYLGVGAGLLVICADDPFCHSSQNEQDSRRFAQFASIPCLDPADPQEARDMAIYGLELSEKFNIPVMLRPTTRVSHARADVVVSQDRPSPGERSFVKNPARRVALPSHARPLHRELLAKQPAIEEELEGCPWNRLTLRGETGVIASGIAGLYAEEALMDLDLDHSLLRIGAYPAPKKLIGRMLEHVSRVLVIEELEPVVEEQVVMLAGKINPSIEILGKEKEISREGELDLLAVRNALARMNGLGIMERASIAAAEIVPPRPPALCPGCSHRATYYAMRRVYGKKAIYPSDIGCYTMAVGMGTVDTCLCMGASITLASGIRFGGETEGICASLGDSTFLHGGMTGLLNAAYNKARITVTILDNSTTAMTGHQPHPGTGVTATGEPTVQVSLEGLARALGAGLVETVDPYDLEGTMEGFQRAKDYPGLSVVIARQPCVIKARRSGTRPRAFQVSDECQGCRICVEYGCPAIEFEGEMAKINNLCTGCGTCAQICPSSAILEVEI